MLQKRKWSVLECFDSGLFFFPWTEGTVDQDLDASIFPLVDSQIGPGVNVLCKPSPSPVEC